MLEGAGRENEYLKGLAGEMDQMALAMTHANFLCAVMSETFLKTFVKTFSLSSM